MQLPAPSGNYETQVILKEPFVILSRRSHPATRVPSLRLSDLSRETFVFYKGRARDAALAACRAAGFEPRIACESSELETVRSLVSAGLGIALLPQLATRNAASNCRIHALHGVRVERQVAILSRKFGTPSASARVFQSLLQGIEPVQPKKRTRDRPPAPALLGE